MHTEELRLLWQSIEPTTALTPEFLQAKSAALGRHVQRRAWISGTAGALALLGWVFFFFRSPHPLQQIGAVLSLAGMSYALWQLRERGTRPLPSAASCLGFYREELRRECGYHGGWRLWARLGALVPGTLIWLAGWAQAHPEQNVLGLALTALLLFAGAGLVDWRAARSFQRCLDSLPPEEAE